jgi:hypothetical protein
MKPPRALRWSLPKNFANSKGGSLLNYMVYAKHKDDKRFDPVDFKSGHVGVGLAFATLIPDVEKAKTYATKLKEECPDFAWQVRVAGKSKIVFKA